MTHEEMPKEIDGAFIFKNVEYVVTLEIEESSLVIEIEDRITTDQWRNEFSVNCLEDITRKTGNFKKFLVFSNMLKSAILKSSDSVSLDLLTYEDLKALRSRMIGGGSDDSSTPRANHTQDNKRYLIVSYSAEFDRVCYPLVLPYMGKTDPRILQQTVRQLKDEIKSLQQQIAKDYKAKELSRLRKEFDKLVLEKESVEAELSECRRELETSEETSSNKQINTLRNIVKNLQQELTAETSRHKKVEQRLTQQCRKAMEKLEESEANERNLQQRIKNLTNELVQCKRSRIHSTDPHTAGGVGLNYNRSSPVFVSTRDNIWDRLSRSRSRSVCSDQSRSNSRNLNRSRDSSLSKVRPVRTRSLSQENRLSGGRDSHNSERKRNRSSERFGNTARSRSQSFDRAVARSGSKNGSRSGSRGRGSSRENSRERPSLDRRITVSRSPSPIGLRFDPTAYEAERRRKLKEIELKRSRQIRGSMSGGGFERTVRRTNSPCVQSRRVNVSYDSTESVRSSIDSLSEIEKASVTSTVLQLIDVSEVDQYRDQSKRTYHLVKRKISDEKLSTNISSLHISDTRRTSTPTEILSENKQQISHKTVNSTKQNGSLAEGSRNKEERSLNHSVSQTSELSDIDARLTRLQEFMKANLSINT